jgi:haloalkane dehalogenase
MNRRNFLTYSSAAAAALAGVTFTAAAAAAARESVLAGGAPLPEPANKGAGSWDPAAEDTAAGLRYSKERRFLDCPFGRIAYIERGSGRPTLLLHGFPLSSFQWRGVIERLSGTRRCLAPDMMGLGYTEVADGQSVTPAAQAKMLATFLDRLNVGEVDLIANDSGGAVAQLFLISHPERVRTLLLTNCDVETDSPPAAVLPIIEAARTGIYPDLFLEPWLRHKDVARSANGLGGMCYSKPRYPSDTALEQYLGPLVASASRKALVNRYTLGLTPNPLEGISSQLRKCSVPTRIVWGMSDGIFSTRSPEYLASVLPRVTGVRRIPEAKLFFPEEYPDVIAEEAQRLSAAHSA